MDYGVTEILMNQRPVAQPSAISLRDPERWHSVFGGSSESSSGVKVNHRSVIGYPPFWRGVNLLANGVAGLPVDVFRRVGEDRQIAKQHPAQKLIKRQSSAIIRARKFRKTLTSHALLFGNGFAWIERNERQQPVGLWVLDPQQMIVRFVDDDLWYCTTINGQQRKFPSRNILHITGLSHDGVVGYSAVNIMAEALGVGMAAQQFGSRFFGQGSNASGLLMIPGHMSEEKIRNTMSAWQQMSEGITNAHKVALLQDGTKFQQLTVAPEQAQFLQTRNFEVRAVVANILGVPPHLLGDDSRTSHNSLEQENQSYLTHSLNPWLTEWEGELELKLLSDREQERGSHFIEFNREAAVQMLFREKVEGLYRQVEMGQLTINESRKMINLPNIGPDGDHRFHPANWLEVGEKPPESESMEPPQDNQPEEDNDEEAPPDTEARNVLRCMIESDVTDAIKIEKRRVVDASKKPDNFIGWVDDFYSAWESKTATALTSREAVRAKHEHAEESKQQLLDVAGCSSTSTLAGNVQTLVATWDDRGTLLTEKLTRTIK